MNTFTLSTFYKSTQCKRAKCNVVPTQDIFHSKLGVKNQLTISLQKRSKCHSFLLEVNITLLQSVDFMPQAHMIMVNDFVINESYLTQSNHSQPVY